MRSANFISNGGTFEKSFEEQEFEMIASSHITLCQ